MESLWRNGQSVWLQLWSGVVANILNFKMVVNEFKLQSRNHANLPINPIYPTPPLGQDMTQGQFLSGV